MKILDILPKAAIIPELKAKDKSAILRELAEALHHSSPEFSIDELHHVLLEREKLGSTGIGSGVAIPHGKLPNLDKIIAVFGRSPAGVDFDAQDGAPTYLFFGLIAPENSAGMHLKALAKLSRLLKNAEFRDALLKAPDAEAIYQTIAAEDAQS